MVIDAILIGAGNRGRYTFGAYARAHPGSLRFIAVAEPDPARRAVFAQEHRIPPEHCHADWRALLASPQLGAAAVIATSDTEHVQPALAALARGYHVLLEKPIAPSPEECVRVVEAAEKAGRMLQIAHVLRYTPFYAKVKEILESGVLGSLHTLDMKEHVAHWHMTHSYVRGKFRNRAIAAPLILAKCCHDLDLMSWFAPTHVRRLSSFGLLSHYRAQNAPPGAPERCSDGCPVQQSCPHDAVRFYVGPDDKLARFWPWTDVSADPSQRARRVAIESGRYGRCVYRCDNDVCDHQVVAAEFEDGLLATFTVQGHATQEKRTIRLSGSRGELRGVFQDGVIEVSRHGELEVDRFELGNNPFGHGGGDSGLLDHFCDVLRRQAFAEARTSGRISLESHLLGFAAEQARIQGAAIAMGEFRARAAGVAS